MSRKRGKALRQAARDYAASAPGPKSLKRIAAWQSPFPHKQAKAGPKTPAQPQKETP